jgi:hypothetical protein
MRMNSPSSSELNILVAERAASVRSRDLLSTPPYKRNLPPKIGGRLLKVEFQLYCAAGDSAGVSSAPAGDSLVAAGASVATGLVISVAAGGGVVGVGLVSGVTVSVFCSHAARSAAPARMQMYFFIVRDAHCFSCSISASAVFAPSRMLLETQMARHEH